MSDEQPERALVPVETREVEFYGDTLQGALVQLGDSQQWYVPLRPICRYLGLDWSAQYRRVQRDPVLKDEVRTVAVMATNPQGGDPDVICLPLNLLPGWLFGVNASRVKPELEEKITRYRRECFQVLWEAFRPAVLPSSDLDEFARPSGGGAELAYRIATAVQEIARQQMELERRLNAAGQWARGIERRVEALELFVGPRSPVDDEQAAALAQAVRNVGHALEQRGSGDYRGVYSQLYARFGISSYKNLRREQYEQALLWLHEWYLQITGDQPEGTQP